MPESSPDFDQIARKHLGEFGEMRPAVDPYKALAEQLRQVWNARGAADRAKVEADLSSQMGATAAGPYVLNLDRALRALDR